MVYDWYQHIYFGQPGFLLASSLLVPLLIWWEQKIRALAGDGNGIDRALVPRDKVLEEFAAAAAFHLQTPGPLLPDRRACPPAEPHNDEQVVNGEGIDIVLCLDISGSMLAQDFTPNRMEAAKNVAAEFIDNRPTDRIGLVIFSGESFTMCPLTTDRNMLKSQLASVQSGLLEDGTAIGSGLATGVDRLRTSPSKSKVIILLTDGENNGGLIDPNTAKEIAKEVGVRVYTIGMGTEGYAPVPVQTPTGVVMQREKVNIDEKLLTQIANETGGHYYRAKDNESLKGIYAEIDRLEKSKIEVSTLRRYTEQFYPFALAAALFLLLELLLKWTVLRKFP